MRKRDGTLYWVSCTSLRVVHTTFTSALKDEHHLPARIVHSRWTLGSPRGPVVIMVPLPPFALPCVAAPSV